MEKGWELPTLSHQILLIVLALLVGNSTRSLAGRLARSLALAAAAVSSALLQGSAVKSLSMLHRNSLLCGYYLHYTTVFLFLQLLSPFFLWFTAQKTGKNAANQTSDGNTCSVFS